MSYSTRRAPTIKRFLATNYYTFTVTAASASIDATYTNNGQTFTVVYKLSGGTTLVCSATGAPAASGTLTKSSGTGDSTISFSSAANYGTYLLPTNPIPLCIRVKMVGGGGGGGASEYTDNTGVGSAGGNTTFGSSMLTAGGGSAGTSGGVGGVNGGTPTISGTGIETIQSLTGGSGEVGQIVVAANNTYANGKSGGATVYGGAGPGGPLQAAGGAAVPNSGAGGGGGGTTAGSTLYSGSGGGAGAFIDVILTSPSSTYQFTVGAGGLGYGGATYPGGAGGSGQIVVEEYYQ